MDEAHSIGQTKRRTFSDEFKRDAVRLISDEKYTFKAAGRLLELSIRLLAMCLNFGGEAHSEEAVG